MNARGNAVAAPPKAVLPALPREFGFFAPVGRLIFEPNGARRVRGRFEDFKEISE